VLFDYFLCFLINTLFDDMIELINNFYPDFDPLLYRDFVLDFAGIFLLLFKVFALF